LFKKSLTVDYDPHSIIVLNDYKSEKYDETKVSLSRRLLKGLGLTGIVLCAACCFLPIAGISVGMSSIAALDGYFEFARSLLLFWF
jgi:hypothetical protein